MKKSVILGICSFILSVILLTIGSEKASAGMNIPEDAFEYNGHFYYYYEGALTWEAANEACNELGGHLVTFSDEEEENAIWEYVEKKGTPAWIGLFNDGAIDRVFQTVDDDWKWVTGEKIKYKNWAQDEPNHQLHFVQNTFDMFAAIGKGEEVANDLLESEVKTPSWGDFDEDYFVNNGTIKGYICEWDIYEIEVEKKSVTLKEGKKYFIKYTVYDKAGHVEVKNAKVRFKSSSKDIAKVSKLGKITAIKKGSTKIKLSYNGAVVKIKVKVK